MIKIILKNLITSSQNINNECLTTSQKMFFIKKKSFSSTNNLNLQRLLHSSKLTSTPTLILNLSKEGKKKEKANHSLAGKTPNILPEQAQVSYIYIYCIVNNKTTT